jgi:hypothetical protein
LPNPGSAEKQFSEKEDFPGTQNTSEPQLSKCLLQGLTLDGCQLDAKFRWVLCPPHFGMATFGRNQVPYVTELLAELAVIGEAAYEIWSSPAGREAGFPQTIAKLLHCKGQWGGTE